MVASSKILYANTTQMDQQMVITGQLNYNLTEVQQIGI